MPILIRKLKERARRRTRHGAAATPIDSAARNAGSARGNRALESARRTRVSDESTASRPTISTSSSSAPVPPAAPPRWSTARAGLKVLLIERGEYPGAKNVSGAVFYGSAILNKLIPNWWEQAPVERYICRRDLVLMSPTTAVSLDFRSAGPAYVEPPYNAFTILRPKFDRWFAAQAEAAGAFLLTSTVVDDVIVERGRVVGVKVRRDEGEIRADVVIACDGVNSLAGAQRRDCSGD